MASRTSPGAASLLRGTALSGLAVSGGGVALALSVPLLFLHVDHQPTASLALGGTELEIALTDLVVLALVLAAVTVGVRTGFGRLRPGRLLWLASAAFLALIFLSTVYGAAREDAYPFAASLVTALKFAEYAPLALAVPLLARTRADRELLLAAVAGWSAVATVAGLLGFAGLVEPGRRLKTLERQPSLLGTEDFAVLSAAALALALGALALGRAQGRARALALVAGLSGSVGVVLSGGLAGLLGVVVAAAGALLVAQRRRVLTARRAAGVGAVVLATAVGVVLMRGGDIAQFLRFAGLEPRGREGQGEVQTYAQRTLLGYIGLRIWLEHPVAGVGWQGSREEFAYGPQLSAARERFPEEPPRAFPSPEHPWGPHNAYVQALADMGAIGLAVLLAFLAVAVAVAAGAALRAPPELAPPALAALLWLLVAVGVSNARGLVAGIPLDALLWLAAGLAVAVRAEVGAGDA